MLGTPALLDCKQRKDEKAEEPKRSSRMLYPGASGTVFGLRFTVDSASSKIPVFSE